MPNCLLKSYRYTYLDFVLILEALRHTRHKNLNGRPLDFVDRAKGKVFQQLLQLLIYITEVKTTRLFSLLIFGLPLNLLGHNNSMSVSK